MNPHVEPEFLEAEVLARSFPAPVRAGWRWAGQGRWPVAGASVALADLRALFLFSILG